VDFNELNTHLCFNKPRADLQMTYCQNKSVALIALYFFFLLKIIQAVISDLSPRLTANEL